ncbi:type III secretion protein [Paraburkholderia sp. BCC1886]|uniref:type III secretion protein n=1 Tax=Paraburkholderia sp. BCC1886 TaxID=2562670 RepID=UPI0011822DBB|nr:type III secretion protein [Paraburkholderia sp. BCC1886]
MYEALERHADDFNDLQNLLADPSSGQRLIDLERALQQSAQSVGDAQGGNELDRSNRSKIYQGLMAASRVIAQLREQELAR